jgi:hypothetical protein
MPFFYRRKPKPPSSTMFVPLLKLFKTTVPRKPSEKMDPKVASLPIDTGTPFLLSGPKSQYGLGISLHFIIIPEGKNINTNLVWHYARKEMRTALIAEGLVETEAEMYALRLIDPINLPPEIIVEYPENKQHILKNLQLAVTYQLLQGKQYTGTLESIKDLYSSLADTFICLATKKSPKAQEAAKIFENATFENIEVVIKQMDIEKRTILDVVGKLREMAKFFDLFSQDKYLKQATPQAPEIIQQLFSKPVIA